MSDGNVLVVTDRGFIFKSMGANDTKRLLQCVEELKSSRQGDKEYRFVIDFEGEGEVTAKDLWLEIGVSSK